MIETPLGAAVTSAGEVWYGSVNHRLNKLDPATNTITTWDFGTSGGTGVQVSVFDTAPGAVWFVFDPPGFSVGLGACRMEEATNTYQCWELGTTRNIAVDPSTGNAWIRGNGPVLTIDPSTGVVTGWNLPSGGPAQGEGAEIQVDANGDVWTLGSAQ